MTFNQMLTGVGTQWMSNTYHKILDVAPTRPIMIGEYGSFESASDIAATPTYLRDLAQKLASSPATAVRAPQPSVAASAETSTTPLVASKPVWLRDALLQRLPANVPAVKAALYFN